MRCRFQKSKGKERESLGTMDDLQFDETSCIKNQLTTCQFSVIALHAWKMDHTELKCYFAYFAFKWKILNLIYEFDTSRNAE